jgi:sulfotransferase
VLGALRGLMAGFFEQPIAEGKTVFDKSRGWLQYIEPVEEIFERRIVLITLVRDVRAIVASWEMLYRRRGIEYRDSTPRREKRIQSATDRARYVLHPRRVTGRSIGRLRDALDRCPDRLLIVPYERLTAQPVETIRVVHRRLGLPDFRYDPDHVEQVTYEDDVQIGLPLHTIRPRIESPPAASWEDVLPGPLCKRISERYADINRLAAGDVVNIVDPCD